MTLPTEIARIGTACIDAVKKGQAHVNMGPAEYQKLLKFLVDDLGDWDDYMKRYLPREHWGKTLAIVVVYNIQLPE